MNTAMIISKLRKFRSLTEAMKTGCTKLVPSHRLAEFLSSVSTPHQRLQLSLVAVSIGAILCISSAEKVWPTQNGHLKWKY